jgi:hypothetical protein
VARGGACASRHWADDEFQATIEQSRQAGMEGGELTRHLQLDHQPKHILCGHGATSSRATGSEL